MSLPPIPNSSYVKHFDGMLWMAYTPKDMKAYGQACRDAALEEAAICAWSHYMDTCKANNIAPANSERWLAAGKIRSLK